MSADTLTDAGLRHLRELWEIEQRDGQAIWRPVGGGENACAQRIYETTDYLQFVFEHGAPGGFVFTPAGREALARYDAPNDDVSQGAPCHTGSPFLAPGEADGPQLGMDGQVIEAGDRRG